MKTCHASKPTENRIESQLYFDLDLDFFYKYNVLVQNRVQESLQAKARDVKAHILLTEIPINQSSIFFS